MDILALHRSGLTQRAIARKLGVSRNTVKRYVENPERLSDRQGLRQRASKLDQYKDNMLARGGHELYGHMDL